jgi:hypothetical protein
MTIDLDSETAKLLLRELQAGQLSDAAALLSVALKQFLIAKEFGEAKAACRSFASYVTRRRIWMISGFTLHGAVASMLLSAILNI